jgi:hypothetical protein
MLSVLSVVDPLSLSGFGEDISISVTENNRGAEKDFIGTSPLSLFAPVQNPFFP